MNQIRVRNTLMRLWGAFTLIITIGVFVCLSVNFAIAGVITWAWYPVGACVLALGVVTPLVFGGKHRLLLSTVMLAVLIMPFLLLVERLSSIEPWAWSVGFPIAALSVLVLLLAVILFRYTRMNRWYCAGIMAFAALPISPVTEYVVSLRLGTSLNIWEMVLDVAGCAAVGIVLCVIGSMRSNKQKTA